MSPDLPIPRQTRTFLLTNLHTGLFAHEHRHSCLPDHSLRPPEIPRLARWIS